MRHVIINNSQKTSNTANDVGVFNKLVHGARKTTVTVSIVRRDACNFCKQKFSSLMICGRCRMVKYCCREHQRDDHATHKSLCNEIKRARTRVEFEEQKLRDDVGTDYDYDRTGGDIFETSAGHFWGILETRDYMRARAYLIQQLEDMGTELSLFAAQEDIRDCLRLCRSDNMGLRDQLPGILIRLGRDQEAYDFIRWYLDVDLNPHYDWGDMSLPFLDVKDADALESIDDAGFTRKYAPSLQYLVAAALLKFRIYAAVKSSRAFKTFLVAAMLTGKERVNIDKVKTSSVARKSGKKGRKAAAAAARAANMALRTAPEVLETQSECGTEPEQTPYLQLLEGHREVLQNIQSFVYREPVTLRNSRIKKGGMATLLKNDGHLLAEMEDQLSTILDLCEIRNTRIWKAMVNPKPLLSQGYPAYYSSGTANEAFLAVKSLLPAWKETEGGIELLVRRVGKKPKYDHEYYQHPM